MRATPHHRLPGLEHARERDFATESGDRASAIELPFLACIAIDAHRVTGPAAFLAARPLTPVTARRGARL